MATPIFYSTSCGLANAGCEWRPTSTKNACDETCPFVLSDTFSGPNWVRNFDCGFGAGFCGYSESPRCVEQKYIVGVKSPNSYLTACDEILYAFAFVNITGPNVSFQGGFQEGNPYSDGDENFYVATEGCKGNEDFCSPCNVQGILVPNIVSAGGGRSRPEFNVVFTNYKNGGSWGYRINRVQFYFFPKSNYN